jgi:drug/metabolite transporter (DMT)-like permease
MDRGRSLFFLFLAPVCWSLTGMLVKYIPWGPWAVTGWRSLFSACFLWLFFKTFRPENFRFDWSPGNLAISCSYSAFTILFAISAKLTTAANTILLQYSAPVYVALLSPWLLREKTATRDWFFVALTVMGLSLFLLNDIGTDDGHGGEMLGLAAGAACGFCWGLYMMLTRRKGMTKTPLSSMVIANILNVALCSWAMAEVSLAGFAETGFARNLGWAAVLGMGPLGLGYIFYLLAVNKVTALETSLIASLEPFLAPTWAFMVLGEKPGFWTLIGGSLIMLVALARSWLALKSPSTACSR